MSKKLLFIFNPHSGKGLIKNYLLDIVDIMVKADFEVTIYTTQARGDATKKAAEEAAHYGRIVCSGGDGTLDEVVTGVIQSGVNVPIGYIPAGSTNDFATSLRIPSDMERAARIAVGDNGFPCDMGFFNGDTFVYVAAFGIFTEVSYQTSQELKNVLGHAAYILEGAKRLTDIQSFNLTYESNGKTVHDDFIFGMITNSVSVGGFSGITGSDVKLDDGLFEVTMIHKPHSLIDLNRILTCLTSRNDDTDLIDTFRTSEIHFISDSKIAWTLDGEYGGDHDDLLVKSRKQCVTIFVPREGEEEENEEANMVEFGDDLFGL